MDLREFDESVHGDPGAPIHDNTPVIVLSDQSEDDEPTNSNRVINLDETSEEEDQLQSDGSWRCSVCTELNPEGSLGCNHCAEGCASNCWRCAR